MKKLLFTIIFILFTLFIYSQTKGSKYRKLKGDQIEYVVKKAYWEEFVSSTNKLYSNLRKVKKASDYTIMIVTRFLPGGKKIRLFYKGGKLVAKYSGNNFIHYEKSKSKKKNSEINIYKYKRQRGDVVTYMSEKKFYYIYLKKKKGYKKKRKIMVVSRLTPKRMRYKLFYKRGKLVGQYINGKYFKN